MKKIYFALLVIIVAGIIGITGCKKNQEVAREMEPITLTAEGLSKDESFIKFNTAISRFDPQYLVLVYKDKRTIKEITERSNDLLIQLNTNPESILYQKQLADFYHFASVDQLKQYSATITENLKKLDAKYDFQKTLFTGNGGQLYYKARGLYAKDQVNALQNADKGVRTNGLWLDLVESELSSFENYNNAVYDETLEDAGESGGGGCTESCCFERETCKKNAKSKYLTNLWLYTSGGAAAAGAAGGTLGSAVPFWGNIAGMIGGGIWGGAMGAMTAMQIYQNDQEACNTTYKACIQKKWGN
jgi:hypothetical protein